MIKFRCDRCGCSEIEEILINVVQRTVITDFEKVGDEVYVDYGDHSLDGGEVEGYCCMRCGATIGTVNTPEDLADWLAEKGMIE